MTNEASATGPKHFEGYTCQPGQCPACDLEWDADRLRIARYLASPQGQADLTEELAAERRIEGR